jgi:DNA-binding MarR family transcriptional regulator
MSRGVEEQSWALLTNHAHVLMSIADEPEIRIREIAAKTGITERAAQRIIGDLEAAGFLSHSRVGRRNHYEVAYQRKSAHPLERHLDVNSLRDDVAAASDAGAAT